MKLEPGMVNQVAALVEGWGVDVLDAITGHLTPHEADLLARVFASHGGVEAAMPAIVSFMVKTKEDSENRADWAGDAYAFSELGWLDDDAAWEEARRIWGDYAPSCIEMHELVAYQEQLDEEYRVQQIRGV